MMFPYRIVTEWSEADDAFIARVPALPNCAAHGDSAAEAVREAEYAGKQMIAILGAKAPPTDRSSEYSGSLRLRISKTLHATLARRAAMDGVSLNTMLVELLAKGSAPLAALDSPNDSLSARERTKKVAEAKRGATLVRKQSKASRGRTPGAKGKAPAAP